MSEPVSCSNPGLAHDLRGPLVTIEGFVGEIAAALDELELLIADGASANDVSTRLGVLLEADLRPCIDFVTRSATMMHARIDAIDADDPSSEGEP